MFGISSWIISVASVCVLSLLVDLILPSGSTNSLIKKVLAYIIVLIVLLPIPNFFKMDFSIENIIGNAEYSLQYNYIYSVNQNKVDSMTEEINNRLSKEGLLGVVISISADIFKNDIDIDTIYVDLYNLVISEDNKNINIKKEIITIIQSVINIREDQIVFYE